MSKPPALKKPNLTSLTSTHRSRLAADPTTHLHKARTVQLDAGKDHQETLVIEEAGTAVGVFYGSQMEEQLDFGFEVLFLARGGKKQVLSPYKRVVAPKWPLAFNFLTIVQQPVRLESDLRPGTV
jgi:hypothetical protein